MFARRVGFLVVVASLMVATTASATPPCHKPLPPGIVSVDTVPYHQLKQKMIDGYRPEIPWDEAFGEFVDVNAYIPNLSVDEVYDFIQDISNFKYWTMAEYDPQPMGQLNGRNRYSAFEPFPPFGTIYLTEEKHPEAKTVDWWVGPAAAGSDPNDIWMHYYVRILDAQKFIGKPGAIINWVNFGHAKFWNNPDLYQGFRGMRVAHAFERDNLVKILNWRAQGNQNTPFTPEVMAQLGLINIHNYGIMDIWMMVMGSITPTVTWEELNGGFISSHFFVLDVPFEQSWDYLTNLRNMNQWTVSTRGVIPYRDDFVGAEVLSPLGMVMADTDTYEAAKTFDIRMANTRFFRHFHNDKWMTSSFRILDAADSVGKVGTVVVWTTFKHANYDALPELANEWKYLPVRNKYAAENMKLLLTQP